MQQAAQREIICDSAVDVGARFQCWAVHKRWKEGEPATHVDTSRPVRSTGRDRLGDPSPKRQIDKAEPQYEPEKPALPDTFFASRVLLHKQLEQIHLENLTWGTVNLADNHK